MSPIPAPTDTVQRCDALSRSLTSILVSRFLLNLQAVDQQSTGTVSPIGSQVESVVFQRVVGSFGGSIEFGRDTVPDDYDHDGAEVEGEDKENRTMYGTAYIGERTAGGTGI